MLEEQPKSRDKKNQKWLIKVRSRVGMGLEPPQSPVALSR